MIVWLNACAHVQRARHVGGRQLDGESGLARQLARRAAMWPAAPYPRFPFRAPVGLPVQQVQTTWTGFRGRVVAGACSWVVHWCRKRPGWPSRRDRKVSRPVSRQGCHGFADASRGAAAWREDLPTRAAMTSQARSITLDQKVRPNAKSPSGMDHLGLVDWRRGRDSDPRWGLPHTRFPGVRLKPLIHLSEDPLL